MAEQPFENAAQRRAYLAFEALVTGNDEAISLAQAALLIAAIEYPDLDQASALAQLDALAHRVRLVLALPPVEVQPTLPETLAPQTVLEAMNEVLFVQEQFHGNVQDYYNPANSFLHKVLEDHTGIPITLSLLYIEVGKRVGLTLDGIGLPLHFMVGCRLPQGERLYIDAFDQGRFLSEQECRALIRRMAGGRVRFHVQWFEPVSHKQFLQRMLLNLKHIYLHHEAYSHVLAVCNRLLLLEPVAPSEWRDRGIVHLQLRKYGRALSDLKMYVKLSPEAEDRDEMLGHIKTLRQIIALLN
jgi:regulator of sirC expression with transglutaminase-like and TPR domain